MSTGQFMTPDDGPRWFFDAGAESLDFVYAEPTTIEALGSWLAERFDRVSAEDVGDRDLSDALGLRAALSRLYPSRADDTAPEPDDVDTLNLFAAMPDIPPMLLGGQRQAGTGRVRINQALATMAREAVANLSADEGRVRRCDAEDCRLVFHDESRTNNRRWCSMERCGNRAKVRAHRERAAMRRLEEKSSQLW